VHARLQGIESLTASGLIEKLLDARRAMTAGDGKGAAAYREYEEFDRKLALARAASAIFDAGFANVVAADFELALGTREAAGEAAAFAEMQVRQHSGAQRRAYLTLAVIEARCPVTVAK
jgi:hypothetical protein